MFGRNVVRMLHKMLCGPISIAFADVLELSW